MYLHVPAGAGRSMDKPADELDAPSVHPPPPLPAPHLGSPDQLHPLAAQQQLLQQQLGRMLQPSPPRTQQGCPGPPNDARQQDAAGAATEGGDLLLLPGLAVGPQGVAAGASNCSAACSIAAAAGGESGPPHTHGGLHGTSMEVQGLLRQGAGTHGVAALSELLPSAGGGHTRHHQGTSHAEQPPPPLSRGWPMRQGGLGGLTSSPAKCEPQMVIVGGNFSSL